MHWYTRIAYACLWLAARLPLRVHRATGAALGWLFWVTNNRKRRIVEANLALVCPGLDPRARRRLARRCLHEAGVTLVEALGIWTHPRRTLALVREVRGQELFDAALATGRGVILCAPHLGAWEVANLWVGARTPFATFYTPVARAQGEALLRSLRGEGASVQIPIGTAGIRRVFGVLHGGGVVSIMPDHVPRMAGVIVPFFGVPALTMTLLPRLAARSGASVLLLFVERLPAHQGFRVHFRAAPPALSDADPRVACAAMNGAVEACVRSAFTQYQWTYKRYKPRPGSGLGDAAYAAAGVPS